jgi:choline kinase
MWNETKIFSSKKMHLSRELERSPNKAIMVGPVKQSTAKDITYMNENHYKGNRVTTACLLAAGTGSRLQPLTDSMPKCLTEINGWAILERLVNSLLQHGFKRLVVVVGHFEDCIQRFLDKYEGALTIDYITNPLYQTTNNIYSLWLARDEIQEPFLLIESDLIFDAFLLEDLLYPDKIAVSQVLPWMNGTTITMNSQHRVSAFDVGNVKDSSDIAYKTVNIYSLSRSSWRKVIERLDLYISAGRLNEYYEMVFQEMIVDGSLSFECVFFDAECWYEVDTLEDLCEAEQISWQQMFKASPARMP